MKRENFASTAIATNAPTTTQQCLVLVSSNEQLLIDTPFALPKRVEVAKCATHRYSCTENQIGNE